MYISYRRATVDVFLLLSAACCLSTFARPALAPGRQVKRVRCRPLELSGNTSLPDPEQLEEYGMLVPPHGPGGEWSAPTEPFDMDTAYVYVLTK